MSPVPVKAKNLFILFDLLASFDTADHGILMEELMHCGIWDSALALLKSYLEA